jgi:hypothetical protein
VGTWKSTERRGKKRVQFPPKMWVVASNCSISNSPGAAADRTW